MRVTVVTVPLGAALWFTGHAFDAPPAPRAPLLDFLYVVVWGGAQQFVLQTTILRESQAVLRRGATIFAAAIFASLHLPNPFLTGVTIAGALCWCAIYDRYPNVVPLAVSHGLGTLALRHAFDPETLGRLRVGYSYLLLGGP